jgi:hypothetical protein
MQLHPSHSELAAFYTLQSIAAGFVGLDFSQDIGNLFQVRRKSLPEKSRDYWAFAHSMDRGDLVLVICHHFPFALVEVDGEYNYVRKPVPEIGVWFRHFRRVKNVRYYADRVTNAQSWEQVKMTDTISPLHDSKSASWQLIESWK